MVAVLDAPKPGLSLLVGGESCFDLNDLLSDVDHMRDAAREVKLGK